MALVRTAMALRDITDGREILVKQIRQFLKDGKLEAGDVPLPAVGAGDVLIRTQFSFVSVGTEKMKLTQARMNLAEKARERPDQVRQVLQTLAEQGLMPTLRKIEERLKAPAPLGYSCAGLVAQVGGGVDEFRVGDRVAAIGEGLATHAEFNSVPRNLVVRVPDAVPLDVASSSAIGAIALQSVRQAGLELGESVAVIGLGLLGQFALQLARANGCRVVGVDLDPAKCSLAVRHGAEAASSPEGEQALLNVMRMTAGLGVDAVLVTTSTSSNQPIELAARLVRDRGRVVCLGNTQIELDWRTWFGKEIDFRFSRAMGAGMYDPDYLTRGHDYPAGYVRWTANRNLQAFLELVAEGKLDIAGLITHRHPFAEGPAVFDRIANGEMASAVGIVLEYPEADARATVPATIHADAPVVHTAGGIVRLGMIGAGNYVRSMILPQLASLAGWKLEAICTARGMNADALAKRYGFARATTDAAALMATPSVDAVAIATRHESHARLALAALSAGRHAYVEKPLALDEEQLAPLLDVLARRGRSGPTLWLGHNRRFSPLSRMLIDHMRGVPVRQVTCMVRSAGVPADSWYQDAAEGGGVLFGDVCHFIDLAIWFQDSVPTEVHAIATPDPSHREESWAIQMRFANGGLATVHYVCGSEKGWERETIDVLGGGRSARLAAFRTLTLNGESGTRRVRRLQPDLGQKDMLVAMHGQFSRATGAVDYTDSFVASAQALLAAHRSILERRVVIMDTAFPFSPS
jgi:predicted dehydrogenase